MSKIFIEEETLTAICDAIREKEGSSELVPVNDMSARIMAIQSGGGSGGEDLPEEAFSISGDCSYRFYNSAWDWFIDSYGDRVTTEGITSLEYTFYESTVEKIPFVINNTGNMFTYAFYSINNLTECPKIRGPVINASGARLSNMVSSCSRIRDFEDLFESGMLDGFSTFKVTSSTNAPRVLTFAYCYSLRRVPTWWRKLIVSPDSTTNPGVGYVLYANAFSSCGALDEVLDIPVLVTQVAFTSNMFTSSFNQAYRIKAVTFETNDGQPIAANWKTQTIDLSQATGYSNTGRVYIIDYNSGITADKEVKDDATYQALKNDPDWFTTNIAYSRYNHDSAVETINSLPDTSAYLASAGGTNTIKFKGAQGSLTDGGAISDLTAEEIAVATAKGWTVTLV